MEKDDWTSKKGTRRTFVAKDYRVLLLVGDNYGDFSDDYSKSEADRLASLKVNISGLSTRLEGKASVQELELTVPAEVDIRQELTDVASQLLIMAFDVAVHRELTRALESRLRSRRRRAKD